MILCINIYKCKITLESSYKDSLGPDPEVKEDESKEAEKPEKPEKPEVVVVGKAKAVVEKEAKAEEEAEEARKARKAKPGMAKKVPISFLLQPLI